MRRLLAVSTVFMLVMGVATAATEIRVDVHADGSIWIEERLITWSNRSLSEYIGFHELVGVENGHLDLLQAIYGPSRFRADKEVAECSVLVAQKRAEELTTMPVNVTKVSPGETETIVPVTGNVGSKAIDVQQELYCEGAYVYFREEISLNMVDYEMNAGLDLEGENGCFSLGNRAQTGFNDDWYEGKPQRRVLLKDREKNLIYMENQAQTGFNNDWDEGKPQMSALLKDREKNLIYIENQAQTGFNNDWDEGRLQMTTAALQGQFETGSIKFSHYGYIQSNCSVGQMFLLDQGGSWVVKVKDSLQKAVDELYEDESWPNNVVDFLDFLQEAVNELDKDESWLEAVVNFLQEPERKLKDKSWLEGVEGVRNFLQELEQKLKYESWSKEDKESLQYAKELLLKKLAMVPLPDVYQTAQLDTPPEALEFTVRLPVKNESFQISGFIDDKAAYQYR